MSSDEGKREVEEAESSQDYKSSNFPKNGEIKAFPHEVNK